MSTEALARTHCPTCGAKLHRTDLSLCAYCAAPLQLGGKIEHEADETAQRLARLREHATYASAMAWAPRDPETEARARRTSRTGALLAALALAIEGLDLLRGTERPGHLGISIAAGLALVAGLALALQAALLRRRSRSLPMLRRPALVVSRRSMTSEKRGPSATTYFFLLHFDDGGEGEFRWPGQGTMVEPMPNGTTGLAYTRGEKLLDLRRF